MVVPSLAPGPLVARPSRRVPALHAHSKHLSCGPGPRVWPPVPLETTSTSCHRSSVFQRLDIAQRERVTCRLGRGMTVREDGFYLVDQVRRLAADRPVGNPWKANEIVAAIDRASPYSGDHERFYLAFLEGIREILSDDEDAVLTRFMRQAVASELKSGIAPGSRLLT